MFIAHRGKVIDGVKENSFAAIWLAIKDDKYGGVEMDLRVSSDGVLVLVHDAIEDGVVVKHTKYSDLLGISTLSQVLEIATDKVLMIEIKDSDIDLDELVSMLNASGRRIYVMSFDKEVIRRISKMKRVFKVGVLNYVLNSDDDYSWYDFVCLIDGIVTKRIVDYFTIRGIEVVFYGVRKGFEYNDKLMYIVDDKLINK